MHKNNSSSSCRFNNSSNNNYKAIETAQRIMTIIIIVGIAPSEILPSILFVRPIAITCFTTKKSSNLFHSQMSIDYNFYKINLFGISVSSFVIVLIIDSILIIGLIYGYLHAFYARFCIDQLAKQSQHENYQKKYNKCLIF